VVFVAIFATKTILCRFRGNFCFYEIFHGYSDQKYYCCWCTWNFPLQKNLFLCGFRRIFHVKILNNIGVNKCFHHTKNQWILIIETGIQRQLLQKLIEHWKKKCALRSYSKWYKINTVGLMILNIWKKIRFSWKLGVKLKICKKIKTIKSSQQTSLGHQTSF
jgi:hypothetical protein